MLPNDLVIWCALLVKCDSGVIDLIDADASSLRVAALMHERGLLDLVEPPFTYTLTSRGMACLAAVERLKEFSIAES